MRESYIIHKYEMYYGKNKNPNADIIENPLEIKLGKCPRRQTTPEDLFKFRKNKKIAINLVESNHLMKTRRRKDK